MAEKTNTPTKKYTLKDKIKAMGPGLLVVGSFIGPAPLPAPPAPVRLTATSCCGAWYSR